MQFEIFIISPMRYIKARVSVTQVKICNDLILYIAFQLWTWYMSFRVDVGVVFYLSSKGKDTHTQISIKSTGVYQIKV